LSGAASHCYNTTLMVETTYEGYVGALLNVDEALKQILATINPLPDETLALANALGRVIAQDVIADSNLPPFSNSSMDGFALRAADIAHTSAQNPVGLRVVMDIPAGVTPTGQIGSGEAARIMTGAPLPQGADAVVPVESTNAQWKPGSNE